jgi:hypothetical protein
MVVADQSEDALLSQLREAMWDLWFCAKRTEPCDPMSSDEPKIKASRDSAFDALHAIHMHAEDSQKDSTATAASADVISPPLQASALLEKAATEQTPTAQASEWANRTMVGLLNPPNVTGKLWDAIHDCDMDDVLLKDVVTVTNDEDGNMKKLKANMLIMHECASMPDCPGTDCCLPKNPTQEVYKQARDDAYVAYHQILEDDDMSKKAYIDILRGIAGEPSTTTYYPPGHPLHTPTTSTLYPPGHPLHGTEHVTNTTNTSNTTEAKTEVVQAEEGSMLLYALCGVTVVVILAILFLVVQTRDANPPPKAAAAESWGGENWEGEGYGGY